MQLFTIGHSTHSLDDFLALLTRHEIALLADVRRFPGSRKHPQFNAEELEKALVKAGIGYRWFEALGGRRRRQGDAPDENRGLRNDSFRNYADYMQTDAFVAAIDELLALAGERRTAYMCSEGLFWRCHRRLVSDYLLARGHTVQHIMPGGALQAHALTSGARVADGRVTYPGEDAGQGKLFE